MNKKMIKESVIRTRNDNKIAKLFFVEFTTIAHASEMLYPTRKYRTVGIVAEVFKRFKERGFIEEKSSVIKKIHQKGKNKGKTYLQRAPHFRLHNNIIYEYLKEKRCILDRTERRILDEFFSNEKIRHFLVLWNDEENKEFYIKSIIDTAIDFLRICFNEDISIKLGFIFSREIVKEFFKILEITEAFVLPRNNDGGMVNRNLSSKRHKIIHKIDSVFDTKPFISRINPAIPYDTKDKEELLILKIINS